MSILSDLLAKAPQSVKDKYKIKIRDKAIERVKEKMVKHNKTINIVIRIPLINLLESGTAQAITFVAKNNPAI